MTAAIVIGIALLVYALYRVRLRDLQWLKLFERHATAFHEAVKPLVEDNETPTEVLNILETLNSKLMDRGAAVELLEVLLRWPDPEAGRAGNYEAMHRFFMQRPELERCFVDALTSAILAMSYRNRWVGPKLRLWLSAVETKERKEQIASSYSDFVVKEKHAALAA